MIPMIKNRTITPPIDAIIIKRRLNWGLTAPISGSCTPNVSYI
jgi:hypothetical protein